MEKQILTPEQFEQAKRDFEERWRLRHNYYCENQTIDFLSDLTALLEQHKEMMLREELIKYDKWLCQHDLGYKLDTNEKCVDEYIKSLKP